MAFPGIVNCRCFHRFGHDLSLNSWGIILALAELLPPSKMDNIHACIYASAYIIYIHTYICKHLVWYIAFQSDPNLKFGLFDTALLAGNNSTTIQPAYIGNTQVMEDKFSPILH